MNPLIYLIVVGLLMSQHQTEQARTKEAHDTIERQRIEREGDLSRASSSMDRTRAEMDDFWQRHDAEESRFWNKFHHDMGKRFAEQEKQFERIRRVSAAAGRSCFT